MLIVTGLIQEARIATGPGRHVICASSNPDQLRRQLADLDARSYRGVISFGVAGGLDPDLQPGDVVVASSVVSAAGKRWLASELLSNELIGDMQLDGARVIRGRLTGAEKVITTRSAKAALRAETGGAAVDMESHIAANFAINAGVPFAALRVVSDPSDRALPEIATKAVKPDGGINLPKVLLGIARNPLVIGALISTGRDFSKAMRSLKLSGARMLKSTPVLEQAA